MLWQLKMAMFRRQQPKQDHNPWFVPETTSILSTFAYTRSSPRALNICRLRPFHGRLHRVKFIFFESWPKYSISYRRNALHWINSCTNVFMLPVIIEVSFKKIAHFPKVPAHTGLTILDCRKRKTRHWKSQNGRAVWIFEWFKQWLIMVTGLSGVQFGL